MSVILETRWKCPKCGFTFTDSTHHTPDPQSPIEIEVKCCEVCDTDMVPSYVTDDSDEF